jgi:hypothetical protein
MKQDIILGAAVDDSTGDYIRQGGLKIKSNFDEAYTMLGDGTEFHPAGAFKTWSWSDGSTLGPDFGEAYNINTLQGVISVTLPKGSPAEYGRVIKLRDVHASWGTNDCIVRPMSGDSIGGSTNPVNFATDFSDMTFVYSSPATWRYINNMRLDSVPQAPGTGVVVQSFRVTGSQYTDGFFTNISTAGYNSNAVQVYRNGTLLTYDSTLVNTDYGSKSGSTVGRLNGVDIYVPYVVNGDVITIISYSKGIASSPVSYVRYDVQMLDPLNPTTVVSGQTARIKVGGAYNLTDFGCPEDEEINPAACQILVNGTVLVEAGKAGLNPAANEDYKFDVDSLGRWNKVYISPDLTDGDIVSIIYYNTEIGSILEWDSPDGIKSRAATVFLDTSFIFSRSDKIRYTDTSDATAQNMAPVAGTETNIRFANVVQLLESIYPIGSLYMNANNPANPSLYMGFGTWARYAKGRTIFGFDDTLDNTSQPDPLFGINSAVLDEYNNPAKIAGNLIGSRQVQLTTEHIPQLDSDREFLREALSGTGEINLTGCLPDPDQTLTPLATYELATVNFNATSGQTASDFAIIPPAITTYIWVRTA